MKTRLIWCVLVTAVLLLGGRVLSQDKPQMPDMQEMMKKWMAASTPGAHHMKLDYFVGTWETVTKMWMGGPGSEPVETKGTATMKWVLDGRFLLQELDSQMMWPDESGQMKPRKHQGMGLHGYDNYRNMYVGTWADNTNTALITFAGAADPSGKVFTEYGEMDEPMLDVRGRMVKYVTRIVDNDHFVFEIFDLHAGPDYKVLQLDYARRK